MKRLLLVIAFLLGLFAIDRGIAAIMRAGFTRIQTGELGGQINEALAQRDSDIIVFGSSLAKHHISPAEITEATGETCFNAGCNGQDIYYARMLEALLLQNNTKAKTFVYILNWSDLYRDDIKRARVFAPFIDECDEVREMLYSASVWEPIKYQSHAYQFNSVGVSIVKHLLLPGSKGEAGFFGIEAEYRENPADTEEMRRDASVVHVTEVVNEELFSRKLKLYEEFIVAAQQSSIKTVFVIPPTYRHERIPMGARERLARIQFTRLARKHDVPIFTIDETTTPEFKETSYFGDQRHLNMRGAELLSRRLAEQLALRFWRSPKPTRPMISSTHPSK